MVIDNSLSTAICPICQEKKYSLKGVSKVSVEGDSPALVVGVYTCDHCGHVVMKTPVEVK